MSSFLKKFAQSIDYVNESRAPVDLDGARPSTAGAGRLEAKLTSLGELIASPAFQPKDLPAYLDALSNKGVGIDDRKLLLEKVLVLMARLKDYSLSKKVQEAVISLLYMDLPHPVSGYLKLPPTTVPEPPKLGYVHRPANGSYYNPLFPSMGMAGTPYARTVPSRHALPRDALPDPDLVFDTLLKRDKFVPHPGGMSALFFAFADLVIHSIFKTNPRDWAVNEASGYLDLSVLYGHNEREVGKVRRGDGTGRLWNDVWADYRLANMPPASCALLVLMNRNHNYIAEKLLDINEEGKWTKEPIVDDDKKKAQDDEIFHKTRLVNCGYFMHIILGDYVGAILGLARDASDWRLDPMMPMRSGHEVVPLGEGNVVSVEFNMLYRWHATLSAEDTEWTEEMMRAVFDGKDPRTVTLQEFRDKAHAKLVLDIDKVREWTFAGLKRAPDGRFSDDDLARLLQNSTEHRAGAYKARGIPEVMRIVEVMGIKQGRTWGTCSLNEFRKFMGLKPYESFAEWNPDPVIHTAAESLYRTIDNLELHVGLQAEEPKAPGPGAGLCPGYTISRAILADAVCLTRGDRFFTTEFTPHNLTSWGWRDCQYEKKDGAFGGLLTKLLFRHLPQHYPRGSAYAHFPFMVPSFLEAEWKREHPELVGGYTWTRPRKGPRVVAVGAYAAVKKVEEDGLGPKGRDVKTGGGGGVWLGGSDKRTVEAVKGVLEKSSSIRRSLTLRNKRASTLSPSDTSKLGEGRRVINALLVPSSSSANGNGNGNAAAIQAFFEKKTRELVKQKKFTSVDGSRAYVDVVRDVGNLVGVHWMSSVLGLPLKFEGGGATVEAEGMGERGVWREQEVWGWVCDIAEYVYLNFQPEHDWRLREATQAHSEKIIEFIKAHVDGVKNWFSLSDTKNHLGVSSSSSLNAHTFISQVVAALKDQSASNREIAAQIYAAIVPTVAVFGAVVANVLDFLLEDAHGEARAKVLEASKRAVKADDAKGDVNEKEKAREEVWKYVKEALRLNPVIPGFYRTAAKEVVLGEEQVQAFEVVYCSVVAANRDTSVWGPNAHLPNFNRVVSTEAEGLKSPEPVLALCNTGLATSQFLKLALPAIFSEILALPNLRRGPGKTGRLTCFEERWHGFARKQYLDTRDTYGGLGRSVGDGGSNGNNGYGSWADGLIVSWDA